MNRGSLHVQCDPYADSVPVVPSRDDPIEGTTQLSVRTKEDELFPVRNRVNLEKELHINPVDHD